MTLTRNAAHAIWPTLIARQRHQLGWARHRNRAVTLPAKVTLVQGPDWLEYRMPACPTPLGRLPERPKIAPRRRSGC